MQMIDVSFLANAVGSTQVTVPNIPEEVEYPNVVYDTHGWFSTITNRYTPQIPGKYLFTSHLRCAGTDPTCVVAIQKNNITIATDVLRAVGLNGQVETSIIVPMNGTTDFVTVLGMNSTSTQFSMNSSVIFFNGSLLAPEKPYYVDVGSTVLLGGILMFLIAYWIVGLSKKRKYASNV